jgi:hypothetical protein
LLELPMRQCSCGGDLLLRCGDDLVLVFFNAGLDALLVERRILVGLGAEGGDLFV